MFRHEALTLAGRVGGTLQTAKLLHPYIVKYNIDLLVLGTLNTTIDNLDKLLRRLHTLAENNTIDPETFSREYDSVINAFQVEINSFVDVYLLLFENASEDDKNFIKTFIKPIIKIKNFISAK